MTASHAAGMHKYDVYTTCRHTTPNTLPMEENQRTLHVRLRGCVNTVLEIFVEKKHFANTWYPGKKDSTCVSWGKIAQGVASSV